MTFRDWLSGVVKARGFSGNSLSIASGVDQPTISKILRGARPISEATSRKIAPHLRISHAEIVLMQLACRLYAESPADCVEAVRKCHARFAERSAASQK